MSTATELSANKDARHSHFLRVINSEFSNRGTITTKRSLPTAPKRVPLEARDIPPGTVFRHVTAAGTYANVAMVGGESVWFAMEGKPTESFTYEQLVRNYMFLRPGGEWQPCSKEAA